MITYERYAQIRDSKGLKDSNIAQKAQIQQSVLSDWKNGKSTPKMDKMAKIADALEMDYFAFVGPVGKFSSLNPNRPNTDADIIFNVPGEDMKILVELIKDKESYSHLMEYARLLKMKKDTEGK